MASPEQQNLKPEDHGKDDPVYPPIEEGKRYSKAFVFPTQEDASDFVRGMNPFATRAWHGIRVRVQVVGSSMIPLDELAAKCKGKGEEGEEGKWSDKRWV